MDPNDNSSEALEAGEEEEWWRRVRYLRALSKLLAPVMFDTLDDHLSRFLHDVAKAKVAEVGVVGTWALPRTRGMHSSANRSLSFKRLQKRSLRTPKK